MKKKIKKAFNINDAQNGAKIETKDGKAIRILCYDKVGNNYPIVALLNINDVECCASYTIDGELHDDNDFDGYNHDLDLVIIEEIEYKFNKGDYIVGEAGIVYKITEIDDMYHIKTVNGCKLRYSIEDIDNNFHKWTIQDAKPGDVLIDIQSERPFLFKDCSDEEHPNYPVAYCGLIVSNMFKVPEGNHWWTAGSVRPATKREEELFFDKLKEEGYKWNSDTLTLSKIEKWRDKKGIKLNGYFIGLDANILSYDNGVLCKNSYNVFATEKQAKAALAMAQISQIMANDERFGGAICDEEWNIEKWFVILRRHDALEITTRYGYEYLSFHTKEQAELFLSENEDLIKMYYMLD